MVKDKDKKELLYHLKRFFQKKTEEYPISLAFLYGSWAKGYPKKNSDIDIAILFSKELKREKINKIIQKISEELQEILKKEVNVLIIQKNFPHPMLYYNAIVLGIPLYSRNPVQLFSLRMEAIHQMEDFTLFGLKWQLEVAGEYLKEK